MGRVVMHHHTLDQSFIAEGQFLVPEKPEERIAGTLNYSSGSITVDLIGEPAATLLRDGGGVRELIIGSTSVGPCALWSAFITSSTMTSGVGGDLAVCTYRANRLYVGQPYESVDEIQFRDLVVSYDVLPTWVGHDPFGAPEEGSDALHRYVPFPPVAAVIEEEDLQVELSTRLVDRGGGYQGFTWVHEVRFVIRSPEPKPVEWHLENRGRVQTFLSTVVGGPAVPTSIIGSLDQWTFSHVILPLTRAPSVDSLAEFRMLLTYGRIGDRWWRPIVRVKCSGRSSAWTRS